jgi:prophage regulatory protein
MRILRKHKLKEKTGLSPASIDRLEAVGDFPKRVRLSKNIVGWYEHEIDEWLEDRPRGPLPVPPSLSGSSEAA